MISPERSNLGWNEDQVRFSGIAAQLGPNSYPDPFGREVESLNDGPANHGSAGGVIVETAADSEGNDVAAAGRSFVNAMNAL